MKKPIPWSMIVGAIVIALLTAFVARSVLAGPQTTATPKEVEKAKREIPSSHDERAALPTGNFVAGNGVIEPADREIKVAATVAGRIAKLWVKEGDFVSVGTRLAELDNAVEKAALDAAEGEFAVARAELTRVAHGLRKEDIDAVVADSNTAKARAELSQGSLERVNQLSQGGAATADELDRAKRQAEADKAQLAASEARRRAAVSGSRYEDVLVAQAKVKAAQGRRDQALAAFDRMTVTAPIEGAILQIKYRAGEYYTTMGGGSGVEPIMMMGDTRKLRVRMDVDERDIAKIKIGAPAFATLNAYAGRRVTGRVVDIGRRMGRKNIRTDDPAEHIDTKILEVVFELDSTDGLVPGLRTMSYIDVGK